MGDNSQISCEEFQIMYVYTPPSRRSVNQQSCGLCIVISLQRGQSEKGGEINNFTVENPDKHSLKQVIKIKINTDKASC